jgi:hypothetical protein
MNRIKPEEIECCFMNWVQAVKKDYEREIIAIDGKTVRGHFKGGGKPGVGREYRNGRHDGVPAQDSRPGGQ